MITVMTHTDSDGVISLSLFLKKIQGIQVRAYFTSPVQLRDTICRSVQRKKSLGELYIFDLAGENKAIFAAAIYDKVLWIDHHQWEPEEVPSHVDVVIDSRAKSAAHVVADYFNIRSPLVELGDQIDTNDVRDELAERIRETVGAIRHRYSGIDLNKKLEKLAYELATEDFSVLDSYNELVSDYREWINKLRDDAVKRTRIYRVKDLKVAVYEATEPIPVYLISNELPDDVDIFAVIIYMPPKERRRVPVTKLEFRTRTSKNVLKLAEFYGGGGHPLASGASVTDIITVPELLKAIELLYT